MRWLLLAALLAGCGVKSAPRPPGVPEAEREACEDCEVEEGLGGAGGDWDPVQGED